MAAPAGKRSRSPEPKEANAPQSTNHTIRLSNETWDNWRLWCKVNKMSYEESVVFLLEHHPIEVDKPREAYRFVR